MNGNVVQVGFDPARGIVHGGDVAPVQRLGLRSEQRSTGAETDGSGLFGPDTSEVVTADVAVEVAVEVCFDVTLVANTEVFVVGFVETLVVSTGVVVGFFAPDVVATGFAVDNVDFFAADVFDEAELVAATDVLTCSTVESGWPGSLETTVTAPVSGTVESLFPWSTDVGALPRTTTPVGALLKAHAPTSAALTIVRRSLLMVLRIMLIVPPQS
jgi:hypothetical protein